MTLAGHVHHRVNSRQRARQRCKSIAEVRLTLGAAEEQRWDGQLGISVQTNTERLDGLVVADLRGGSLGSHRLGAARCWPKPVCGPGVAVDAELIKKSTRDCGPRRQVAASAMHDDDRSALALPYHRYCGSARRRCFQPGHRCLRYAATSRRAWEQPGDDRPEQPSNSCGHGIEVTGRCFESMQT